VKKEGERERENSRARLNNTADSQETAPGGEGGKDTEVWKRRREAEGSKMKEA